jgi:hypothetical protein
MRRFFSRFPFLNPTIQHASNVFFCSWVLELRYERAKAAQSNYMFVLSGFGGLKTTSEDLHVFFRSWMLGVRFKEAGVSKLVSSCGMVLLPHSLLKSKSISCGPPGPKVMVHTSMSSFLRFWGAIREGGTFELRGTHGMIVTGFPELKLARARLMFSSPGCIWRTIQEDWSSKRYTGYFHGSVLWPFLLDRKDIQASKRLFPRPGTTV